MKLIPHAFCTEKLVYNSIKFHNPQGIKIYTQIFSISTLYQSENDDLCMQINYIHLIFIHSVQKV